MKRFFPYLVGALVGALMLAAFTVGQASATTGCFSDTNGNWAETFICWLKDFGVSNGYGDGTYGPNDNVTRAEMAVFLKKTASLVRATGTQFNSLSFLVPSVAPNSSADFATVTITVPGNGGALLINGSLNLYCNGGLFSSPCGTETYGNVYVNVDGTNYDRQYFTVENDSGDNDFAWNSSNSAYVPVTGGNHTVSLRVENGSSSTGDVYVWSGGINVLFVAFDGTGTSLNLDSLAPMTIPSTDGEAQKHP